MTHRSFRTHWLRLSNLVYGGRGGNHEKGPRSTMFFHIEERRAWVRRHKRIIVYDCNPDYARFAKDPSGTIKLMLRIWLAKSKGDQPYLCAYLGTITFCFIVPSSRDLFRLFRLTSKAAKGAGESARALRHELTVLLRKHIHEEYGA